jgi:hypothetical protein
MSHPLVLGMFSDRAAAATAARAARNLGVDREHLSIVARTHDAEGTIAADAGVSPGAEIEDSRRAGLLGELSAHLLAAAAMVLPGVGPIVAAGPLGAGLGEAAGHLAGNFTGVLTRAGVAHDRAERWKREIEQGAILLGAHAIGADAADLERVIRANGAIDVASATWQDRG